MMLRARWMAWLWLGAVFSFGCASDFNWPDVVLVEALQGETVVETLELSEVNEDAFVGDIPVDASFQILFDETMDSTTTQENIWIEDAARNVIDVSTSARLEVVTATPVDGPLEPGQNHVLHIGDDIQDISGHELLNGYDISFFTAQ